MLRACQNFEMDNGGIQSAPFFNGEHTVTPKDGDSGDEDTYAPSTQMYRVRRKRYLDKIDAVISKFLIGNDRFHEISLS